MDAKQLLAEVRQQSGMTQIEIAQALEVTQGTVSKIERGETKDVRAKTYQKLLALHHLRVASVACGSSIVANSDCLNIPRGAHA